MSESSPKKLEYETHQGRGGCHAELSGLEFGDGRRACTLGVFGITMQKGIDGAAEHANGNMQQEVVYLHRQVLVVAEYSIAYN